VDQRLGPDDDRIGPPVLDCSSGTDACPYQLVLEPAALVGADAREIAVVHRPRNEVDLVERANGGWTRSDRLPDLQRGEREFRKPLGEIPGSLIDMIWRAVVEQVPDDLHPDLLRRLEHRQPARPVVFARGFLDPVPADSISNGPESQLLALAIVRTSVAVVRRRANKVQAHAVASAMR
jgi:hypothetical protein